MNKSEEVSNEKPVTRTYRSPIKVYCFPWEREQIESNAKQAGISVARYLREVGMGYPVQSIMDANAVLELVRVNGDLARLGNLQKLWLDNDARTARFGVDTINRLLHRIEGTQSELRGLITSLRKSKV